MRRQSNSHGQSIVFLVNFKIEYAFLSFSKTLKHINNTSRALIKPTLFVSYETSRVYSPLSRSSYLKIYQVSSFHFFVHTKFLFLDVE